MSAPGGPAVLFDVDGTLVDSNYLQVIAWTEAFRSVGHAVDSWRVHRRIGICSPQLLESLLGDEAARLGERASAEHTHYYHDAFDQLRPLAGARELLHSVADLGLQVVLATSAKPHELDRLRQVLDADGAITAVVGSGDVETAKPAPDLEASRWNEPAARRSRRSASATRCGMCAPPAQSRSTTTRRSCSPNSPTADRRSDELNRARRGSTPTWMPSRC